MKPDILVLRHVSHEHLGTLAPVFEKRGFSHDYLDVWKKRTRFPSAGRHKALVIMGGPMGVYEKDKYPFLPPEIAFIKKFISTGKPVLGICLGSQLIAHALGADVYPNKRKEIGWYPLETSPAGRKDPAFKGFSRRSTVFQWHGDTFDLPRATVRLASSPLCRNQAFRYRDNVYGLQFHIEVDGKMVREWVRQPGALDEIKQAGPRAHQKLLQGLKPGLPALKKIAAPFFESFVDRIQAPRKARSFPKGSLELSRGF